MRKRNKIVFLLVGFAGIAVLLPIILYFLAQRIINSEVVKKQVSAYFLKETGGRIAFEKSDLLLFPIPHIDFRQVTISVSDKATGLIQFVDVYPDVRSLLRGDLKFSRLEVGSPRFSIALSEQLEKTSLEQIEQKIKSIVTRLTSVTPNISIVIQGGKLDLTKREHVVFSFHAIRSRLAASGKSLNISLTCSSNLWDSFSFKSLLDTEDLKSDGTFQVNDLHPHALMRQLFPNIGWDVGDSDASLSVKFQALGLRQVKAEVVSSVSGLVLTRGKSNSVIKDLNLKGDVDIGPEKVSVLLDDFSSTLPGLRISGKYILDRTSGIRALDLEGKSIDVQSARNSAIALVGDVPVIRDLFDVVQGGRVSSLYFSTHGKSPDDLGSLNNMRISGRMFNGDIYIRSNDLSFHGVTGNAVISRGILRGGNIEGHIAGNRVSKGQLRVGLKGQDAPFYLDVWAKVDAGRLPSFLKEKHLVTNDAVLREMGRLSDTHGGAEGRLILGDRLDSIHAVVDVSQIDLVTRYEPVPFPVTITGGHVFFDEKSIKTTNLNGSLGNTSFAGMTAGISLDDKADFEISRAQIIISADEIYPWVTSFEKIKPGLKELPSMKGTIVVSSVKLQGFLYQPKDWQYLANGELRNFTFESAFFPGKAEQTSGEFRVTEDELSLKDVRTQMLDSHFTISGTIGKFPTDIRKLNLSVQGEVGPKVAEWTSGLINLPRDISLRAPVSISASTLSWEKDRRTIFDGRLVFGRETQVSLKLTRNLDQLSVHEISIKDRESDVKADIVLNKKTIDFAFNGRLTSNTINSVLAQSEFSGSSLHGDCRAHVVFKDIMQSVVEGVIAGKKFPLFWYHHAPLIVQDIFLEAHGKSVLVNSAQFSVGEEKFRAKGSIDAYHPWFSVDMDISSDGFDWKSLENFFRSTEKTEGIERTAFPDNFPVRGTLRIQSDSFKYGQFTWAPFHAEVSFNGENFHISSKDAVLCGISTTGDVDITAHGAALDIALSASEIELEPAVLCVSDKTDKRVDITGKFQMKADLKAKGKFGAIAKSLNGSFNFSAKRGKIFKSQPLGKTLSLVNKTKNFKGKFPTLDKTAINYYVLSASGTIKESILNLDEGVLDASSFGILAHGKIDIETEKVDLNALVAPVNRVQRIVGKIPVLGNILGGSLVSIPVKIKGDISDPQVTFLSPAAVGSAFLGIIERTIKLPVSIIEPVLPGKEQE